MKAKDPTKKFTKQEKSWIMYDWANSIYATNIMAAIFPAVFAAMATDAGNVWYGYGVSIASLIVAVLAPVLGAIGDIKGNKKKLLTFFMILGVLFTAVIAVAIIMGSWKWMLIGYVISRIGFSGSCVFYDAFLTDVTTDERMDRVSSWGYAMGYIGGSTIPFVISIVVLLLMGFDNTFAQVFSILIVSVWWLVFSIPILKNVKQVHYIEAKAASVAKTAWKNFITTLKGIFTSRGLLIFVLAYFFYIDGVDTIISMATNFGSTLGLDSVGMILALVVTQIVAVPCSILFSRLADKFHCIKMITVAIAIYFVITIVGFSMGRIVEPVQQKFVAAYDSSVVELQLENEEDQQLYTSIINSMREDGKGKITEGLEIAEGESISPREKAYFSDDAGATFQSVLLRLEHDGIIPDSTKYDVYAFSTPQVSQQVYDAVKAMQADANLRAAVMDEAYTTESIDKAATAQVLFWVLAFMVGTVQGGIQALSRSYYAKLIPPERANEYFGFFDIFGKFAAVVGPALYALCYGATGRASWGILSLIILFFMGGLLLILGKKRIQKSEDEIKAAKALAKQN